MLIQRLKDENRKLREGQVPRLSTPHPRAAACMPPISPRPPHPSPAPKTFDDDKGAQLTAGELAQLHASVRTFVSDVDPTATLAWGPKGKRASKVGAVRDAAHPPTPPASPPRTCIPAGAALLVDTQGSAARGVAAEGRVCADGSSSRCCNGGGEGGCGSCASHRERGEGCGWCSWVWRRCDDASRGTSQCVGR